jgi:hypothetical protein
MDDSEKQAHLAFIAQHVKVGRARLSDAEILLLVEVIKKWPEKLADTMRSGTNNGSGWGSDGKYDTATQWVYRFAKDVGVRIERTYIIDGANHGTETEDLKTARKLVDFFWKRRQLLR